MQLAALVVLRGSGGWHAANGGLRRDELSPAAQSVPFAVFR
jgi:hypothetical protein